MSLPSSWMTGCCGLAAAIVLAAPGSANAAEKPIAITWPAYAGNTIRIAPPSGGKLVAGSVQRVKLSGRAFWKRWPDYLYGYTLGLYAQDAAVDAHCDPTYSGQRQKGINLGSLSAAAGSGWVVDESQRVNADETRNTVDWAFDSLPFSIRPGVRNVVLCAYVRYVIDDVAFFEQPARIEQPRCRLVPSAVRRGRSISVRCNVNGTMRVKLKRAGRRARSATVRIDSNGRGRLSGRRLSAGRWTASFSSGDVKLGSDRVRVR